ncbi:MAG: hypothetical protein GX660_26415 [Clostridiaceae bacterium]|nr:hypothetical protein [Clostridiaceae bacterium]
MIRKISNKMSCITAKIIGVAALATAFIMTSPIYAYADKLEEAAHDAATGIESSGKGMAKWLVMGVLVVGGIILIIGGEKGKESVKSKAPWVIGGIALIMLAAGLATLFTGWFQ